VKKNVLFVIMDGCRASSLGCYGYTRRDTSPFVDSLADKGTVVDRFYAASNCTMPSVITMGATHFSPTCSAPAATRRSMPRTP
jgi:arylsulfatase A-like enzyme